MIHYYLAKQNNLEASPKKMSLNAVEQNPSSSLHIPDSRMSRRKSETPSYNIQPYTSSQMPFLRRNSEAPPPMLLRSSPIPPTNIDDEEDKENKKDTKPSSTFLEPDVNNSISESLNRLAIGKHKTKVEYFQGLLM